MLEGQNVWNAKYNLTVSMVKNYKKYTKKFLIVDIVNKECYYLIVKKRVRIEGDDNYESLSG